MDRVEIGRVLGSRGNRGEIKVLPYATNLDRFESLKEVFVSDPHREVRQIAVLECWRHNDTIVLRLDGVDSIEAARKLSGMTLEVPIDEAVSLDEDEFFVHDLIGLRVYTDRGEPLGKLSEVLSLPSNDVYLVREGNREILVPAVAEFVLRIDLVAGEMVIRTVGGLLDDTHIA